MQRTPRHIGDRFPSGVAAVEFALALPLLLTLTLGCVDLGKIVHSRIVVSNSARVGAEYGATHRFTSSTRDDWEAAIHQAIDGEAESLSDITPQSLVVAITTAAAPHDGIDVTVHVELSAQTMIHWPGLPAAVPVVHSVTMRQYR